MSPVKSAADILRDIEASTAADRPDGMLSTAQAARVIGVSQATLRDWTNAGQVPYVKGKYRRYHRSDVDAFADGLAYAGAR